MHQNQKIAVFDTFFVVSDQGGQKKSWSTNNEHHFSILNEPHFIENSCSTACYFFGKYDFFKK